jgi:hypothetical protein
MLSLEGQQLGNYDVIRRINKGGMGAVYEGRQRTAFGRRVAIKVILGDYATDRDMRRRFAREARTIARLHHPHILPLIEFGDEQGILYLVMPFVDGGTLSGYLRRGLPNLDEVAAIYEQLLEAVEYAHDAGLIHRDIKSSNVLLEERKSGPPNVYLADFGLVRSTRQPDTSQTGRPIPLNLVPGTPHYMAPEQTRGIVTQLTDIYALGVLLFQMLTGELPYNDPDDVRVIEMHLYDPIPSPRERDASLPLELDEVVRIAMAKRQEDRYQNIAELHAAFLSAISGSLAGGEVDAAPVEADIEDGLLIEEVDDKDIPPLKHIPAPLNLYDAADRMHEPKIEWLGADDETSAQRPAPPRRTRELPPVAVREARAKRAVQPTRDLRERQWASDTARPRQRITEEPELEYDVATANQAQHAVRKPRRSHGWMWSALIVPLLLLALLLMPRVLGYSFFPAGFPLLGTAPVATVYITAQSKVLQDQYVLTASPKVKQTNLTTHTIPDHIVQSSASAKRSVQTSGTKTAGGAVAQGFVFFLNNGHSPVTVPAGQALTSVDGQRFQVAQSVVVPTRDAGGSVATTVTAVQAGSAGNVAAHALDGSCCNNLLQVRNPQAFGGGTDPQMLHTVAQADIAGVRTSLAAQLQRQVAQQIAHQLPRDEVMVGQPIYSTSTRTNHPLGAQSDQVEVTVTIAGRVSVYSKVQATQAAVQLLQTSARQTLNSSYQAQGQPSVTMPASAQAGKNGVAYVSVSAKNTWVYLLSPQQISAWQQSIKGATSAAALAYLNAQPGVATVQINLPFGADHLPGSIDDIKIVTVNQ